MKLFVGNLSYNTTEDALRSLFEGDGRTVNRVSIVLDRDTGRSRGFGFVKMPDDGAGRAAIDALNGTEVGGRKIVVNEARPREERGGGGRR